jgi:hypothetical protein
MPPSPASARLNPPEPNDGGATQSPTAGSSRYLADSLLIVLNPRRIPDCVKPLKTLPIDVAYVQGMALPAALRMSTRIIERGGYKRYILTSDDVIVTPDAVRAVVSASRMNPDKLITGYCNLDTDSPLVNITKRPLAGDIPAVEAYDFYRRDELPQRGLIRTGFAGLGLTCLSETIVGRLLPLGWFGTGWSADFHLSKKCEREGIAIAAPVGGFVWHVKERWNEHDRDPEKQLHIGEPKVVIQRHGRCEPLFPISKEGAMGEKIAEKDITETIGGQTFVRVPKGQPIPDDFDYSGTNAEPEAKKQAAPPENKARTSASTKKRK